MKSSKFSLVLHSFQELKMLKEKHQGAFPSLSRQKKISPPSCGEIDPVPEQELFRKAMADVRPLPQNNYHPKKFVVNFPIHLIRDQDAEIIAHLNQLIQKGEGFVIAQTPEYIEGVGYNVNPEIVKRLHQGEFAIESYLDLHGYRVQEAKKIFDDFLKAAIKNKQRGILIIHGRGLSSP
ncbi:MAG: Smr/MutS family protein, partial [Desulfobacterota bacterium]|nr:Smr/MutS family protein [Thermodesulfobacteriota bacterium]